VAAELAQAAGRVAFGAEARLVLDAAPQYVIPLIVTGWFDTIVRRKVLILRGYMPSLNQRVQGSSPCAPTKFPPEMNEVSVAVTRRTLFAGSANKEK
jgi:hypothetical protein